VGPFQSGKTTLLEAILARTGSIPRAGSVDAGTSQGDASAEARRHKMGVGLTAATTHFMGDSYTFIDCPGSVEFAHDMRAAIPAVDAAIVVCEADERKLPQLQIILRELEDLGIPRFLFLNKIDKANKRIRETLGTLQPASRIPLVLRQIVLTDGRNRRMCLLTNLTASELSVEEARALYQKRWGIELFYRGLKQTLGRRKMHSSSPLNAQVELDWTVTGYWMLGLLLWENQKPAMPTSRGIAFALKQVRGAMNGRGDRRETWRTFWGKLRPDLYTRRGPKQAQDWPHKKKDRPCGVPKMRMATRMEVKRAKTLMCQKRAA